MHHQQGGPVNPQTDDLDRGTGAATPDAAWEPPFPYHREAVLLDLDRSSGAHFEASWSDVVLAERDQPEALSGQPGTLLPIRRDQALRYQRDELEAVDHMLVKPSSGISRARQSGRIEARSASFRK